MGHRAVGIAHVLLGLALAPGGGARRVLLRRGVLSETISTRLLSIVPASDEVPIELDRTTIERLVHALQDSAPSASIARPITTGDLLLAVLRANDPLTDVLAREFDLDPFQLEPLLDAEEAAAPEPNRAVLRSRPTREQPPAATPTDDVPVSDELVVLLDIRALLRSLADRLAEGDATTIEARVASDLEGAVAEARLRLAEERRGSIGAPRADELAQRRFVTSLRQAFDDATSLLLTDTVGAARHIGS